MGPCINTNLVIADLYLRHVVELRAFLLRRVQCREIAVELAQETFVRVMVTYENTDAIAAVHNMRALLYRIAGNLSIDHHRLQVRTPEHVWIDDFYQHEALCVNLTDPARVLAARQWLYQLCRMIEELPPQCQRAFLLHKFEGYSHEEIAEQLRITRNAVEKLLIRALVCLRQVVF